MNIADLDDDDFDREITRRIARLEAAHDPEEAARLYQAEVFPAERERIIRAARQRNEAPLDILFVTVGAQPDSPTLAVLATPAQFVVLVHSDDSAAAADQVIRALDLTADRAEKRSIGDGKNPNLLYKVCFEWWKKRGRPKRVGFDLTGGLKTMSAAAAAAGFALPDARIFYIEADQPRICHRIFWINERRLELENPFEVFGEIRRASARQLAADLRYGPAAALYRQLAADTDQAGDRFRAELCAGYDALERMDFDAARQTLSELAARLDKRSRDSLELEYDRVLVERDTVRANADGAERLAAFVSRVSAAGADPAREPEALRSAECLDFIAMLIQTGERRRAQGLMDLAALLFYRATEAMVQRRLALRGGVDPGNVDWPALAGAAERSIDEIIAAYNDASPKQPLDGEQLPAQLGRASAYAMLAVAFPGDVAEAKHIQKFAGLGDSRNRSLLAHGLQKLEDKTVERLADHAQELFAQLLKVEALDEESVLALNARHRFLSLVDDD